MTTRKIAIDVPESVLLAEKTDERAFARELRTPGAVEATDVAYRPPRRLSRAGAEGRVLNLPKGIPSTWNRVKLEPTQQAKTPGAFLLHRRFNPYPSADSRRPSHGRYL